MIWKSPLPLKQVDESSILSGAAKVIDDPWAADL